MPQEEARAPLAQSELDKGRGRGPLFPSPSPSFPLSPSPLEGKGGANPTRNGVLVGLPPMARPPWDGLFLPLLYIRGQGAPQRHNSCFLAVCGAPSTVYSSGHSVVVLRRSPEWITSSTPSPRRRADETLPRHFAGSRVQGTSSS